MMRSSLNRLFRIVYLLVWRTGKLQTADFSGGTSYREAMQNQTTCGLANVGAVLMSSSLSHSQGLPETQNQHVFTSCQVT